MINLSEFTREHTNKLMEDERFNVMYVVFGNNGMSHMGNPNVFMLEDISSCMTSDKSVSRDWLLNLTSGGVTGIQDKRCNSKDTHL